MPAKAVAATPHERRAYAQTNKAEADENDWKFQEGDHVVETMPKGVREAQTLPADARGVVSAINEDGTFEITWDSSLKCRSSKVKRRWVRWVPDSAVAGGCPAAGVP